MAELTKRRVLDILRLFAAEYGEKWDEKDRVTVSARVEEWYAALRGYPQEVVAAAVADVLQTLKYRPRLADVCERVEKLRSATEKTDEDLWAELTGVLYAVHHNTEGYRYEDEGERCRRSNERIYEELSPEIRDYLRSVSELVTIAYMTSEDLKYERMRFMRRVGEIRERQRIVRSTPAEVLRLAAGCKLLP